MEEGDVEISERHLMHIIMAMIEQMGGDLTVTAEKFDKGYEGKAIGMQYLPAHDAYVFTIEDYEEDNDG